MSHSGEGVLNVLDISQVEKFRPTTLLNNFDWMMVNKVLQCLCFVSACLVCVFGCFVVTRSRRRRR